MEVAAVVIYGLLYVWERFFERPKLLKLVDELESEVRRLRRLNKKRTTPSKRPWQAIFVGCTTKKDVKKMYRSLARKFHPDSGGSSETMASLNVLRDRALADIENGWCH